MRPVTCLHSMQDFYIRTEDGSLGCSECDEAAAALEVIKRCECGAAYSRKTWKKLRFAYDQTFEWGEVHEARNCVCGSTIVFVKDKGNFESYAKKHGACIECGTPLPHHLAEVAGEKYRHVCKCGVSYKASERKLVPDGTRERSIR